MPEDKDEEDKNEASDRMSEDEQEVPPILSISPRCSLISLHGPSDS